MGRSGWPGAAGFGNPRVQEASFSRMAWLASAASPCHRVAWVSMPQVWRGLPVLWGQGPRLVPEALGPHSLSCPWFCLHSSRSALQFLCPSHFVSAPGLLFPSSLPDVPRPRFKCFKDLGGSPPTQQFQLVSGFKR